MRQVKRGGCGARGGRVYTVPDAAGTRPEPESAQIAALIPARWPQSDLAILSQRMAIAERRPRLNFERGLIATEALRRGC